MKDAVKDSPQPTHMIHNLDFGRSCLFENVKTYFEIQNFQSLCLNNSALSVAANFPLKRSSSRQMTRFDEEISLGLGATQVGQKVVEF